MNIPKMEETILDLQQLQSMASVSSSPNTASKQVIAEEEIKEEIKQEVAQEEIKEDIHEEEKTLEQVKQELLKDSVVIEETKEQTKEEVEEEIQAVKSEQEDMSWYQWVKDSQWFNSFIDKIYESIETSKNDFKFESKQREVIEKKYSEIVDKYNDLLTETKTKKYEASRFDIDDDLEYILDLNTKIKKDPTNETLREKYLTSLLQQVGNIDTNFDAYEQKRTLAEKRSKWIAALSSSWRTTTTNVEVKDEEKFVPPFIRMSR